MANNTEAAVIRPAPAPGRPRLVLHLGDLDPGDAALVEADAHAVPWAETNREARSALAGQFDLNIEMAAAAAARLNTRRDLRIALWVSSVAAVEAARAIDGLTAVVLSPDQLAVLDARRRTRPTLVAARDLKRGTAVSAGDLSSVRGGPGAGADCLPALIGRRLAYDIAAGSPVDFGKLE